MEFNIFNLLIQTFKGILMLKEFYILGGGLLLLGIIIDLLKHKSKIKWLLGKKSIQELQRLTPSQFENYIEELFRKLGYKTRTVGGVGDGGIDVEAEKNGIVHYIQCKKFISSKVHVGAVRDFYGAIADKIDGGKGYFITTNVFTLDAEKFAEGKPIELVDRFKLLEYMKLVDVPIIQKVMQSTVCPKCGGNLVERKGKFGPFVGCSNYPKCQYTSHV